MFTGSYEHTIDGKGRVSLPAKYREQIAATGSDRLVVTVDTQPCLVAYPLESWQRFVDALAARNPMDPKVRKAKRFFIGNAHEVQFDGNGRILLPATLRQRADLERDVVFAGLDDKIEIWRKDRWAVECDEFDENDLADVFAGGES